MDLKVLFHNPEQLSDEELTNLRVKLEYQRSMPWVTAFFGGFSVYVLERGIMRCHRATNAYVAAAALAGFWLGNSSSQGHTLLSNGLERAHDRDIVNAFDRKYMNTVLNATGFGNNHINIADYSDSPAYKKPY